MSEIDLKQLIKSIREKSTAIVFVLGFLIVIIFALNLLVSSALKEKTLGKISEEAASSGIESEFGSSEIIAYFVHEGDSSWRIAEKLLGDGERYLEIEELNNFNHGQLLDIGQIVFVDVGADATNEGFFGDNGVMIDAGATANYTIEQGDSLWSIAMDNYSNPMVWQEIYQLNRDVIGADPNLILPFTEITLPNIM